MWKRKEWSDLVSDSATANSIDQSWSTRHSDCEILEHDGTDCRWDVERTVACEEEGYLVGCVCLMKP